jgi:hypothetical protein
MDTVKTARRLGAIGIMVSLGYLLFFMGDLTASTSKAPENLTGIRVEDGRGFTRIVFPCDHPEGASIEPDPVTGRFLVTIPGEEDGMTAPPLTRNHPLVKRIEILPDSEKGARVHVILASRHVDWISYRYKRPARTVLYLRPRSEADPHEDKSSRLPDSEEIQNIEEERPESTAEAHQTTPQQTETSLDAVRALGGGGDKSAVEEEKPETEQQRDPIQSGVETSMGQGRSPRKSSQKIVFRHWLRLLPSSRPIAISE